MLGVSPTIKPADVVAHDEENVGLFIRSCLFGCCLLLCLRLRGTRQHGQGGEDNTGGESAEDASENGPPHCVRHYAFFGILHGISFLG
jgi:hypothetical protein